jgi:hypothetical protein
MSLIDTVTAHGRGDQGLVSATHVIRPAIIGQLRTACVENVSTCRDVTNTVSRRRSSQPTEAPLLTLTGETFSLIYENIRLISPELQKATSLRRSEH